MSEQDPTAPNHEVEMNTIKSAEGQLSDVAASAPKTEPEPVDVPAVEPEIQAEPIETLNEARTAILERKAQAYRGEPVSEPEPSVDEAPEVASVETAEIVPAEEPSDSPPVRRLDDGTYVATIKVNGAEQEISVDRLITQAQRVSAAEATFQERAQLRQLNAQLQAQVAELSKQSTGPEAVQNDPPKGGRPRMSKELLQKAFLDGDEQAETELVDYLNSVGDYETPQAVDPNQVAQQAAQMATAEAVARIQANDALAQLQAKDPIVQHMMGDSQWQARADQYSAQLLSEQPGLSPADNVREAVNLAKQDWLNAFESMQQAAPRQEAAPLQRRTQSKQAHAAAQVPQGSIAPPMVDVAPTEPDHRSARADLRRIRAI